jgi:hypothetical protein
MGEGSKGLALGITFGELVAMLPATLSELWGEYSDDKKITIDEVALLVGHLFLRFADAADAEEAKAFLVSQGEAFVRLAPILLPGEYK